MSAATETVTVKGRTVAHNTRKWHVCTNRHTTTSGYSWGWIEGAPGNVCWGNDESFNKAAAEVMCRLHNEWLEEQKPLTLRIKEQTERKEAARKEYIARKTATEKAESAYRSELEKLGELLSLAYDEDASITKGGGANG